MAGNRQGGLPVKPTTTVGEYKKRRAKEVGIDVRLLAVLGAVKDCVYELSDYVPLPEHPYLVIRTFAS